MRAPLPAMAVVFLILFGSLGIAATAGGDCPGMSDYTYQNGECTDNTGDIFPAMEKTFDRDYDLGVQRNNEAEQSSDAGVRNEMRRSSMTIHTAQGDVSDHYWRARHTVFAQWGSPLLPVPLAEQLFPRNAALRRRAEQMFTALVEEYRDNGAHHGYAVTSVGDADLLFVLYAYRAFNGERPKDAISFEVLRSQFGIWETNNNFILGLTDEERQAIVEWYVIRGQLLLLIANDARKRSDHAELAMVRNLARKALTRDTGRDPSGLQLDTLPCLGSSEAQEFTCGGWIKMLRAQHGGAAMTAADWQYIMSPFR